MKIFLKQSLWKSLFIVSFFVSVAFAQTFEEYFEQGNKLYEEGKYNDAIKVYQKAVELNSNSAPLYNALGLAFDKVSSDLSQISWYFKVATDMEPDYLDAYQNLGQVYYRFEKFDKAQKSLLKALALNPNLVSAQYTLAWSYLRNNQPTDAVHYFKETLKVSNKLPQAYYGLGLAYAKGEDYPGVLEAVTSLRSMGEDDLAAQLEAGIRKPYEEKPVEQVSPLPAPHPVPSSTTVRAAPPQSSTVNGGSIQGSTRVRLRGRLFNSQQENAAPSQANKQYGVNSPATIPPPVRPSRTYQSLPSY